MVHVQLAGMDSMALGMGVGIPGAPSIPGMGGYTPTDEEIAQQIEMVSQQIEQSKPWTVDIAQLNQELAASGGPSQIGFMTVQEGGEWFVSPTLTIAELVRQSIDPEAPRGSAIAPAAKFDTPEAATQGLLDGLAATATSHFTDWTPLASALPLAERRLVSLYGPSLPVQELQYEMGDFAAVIENFSGTSTVDGNVARVLPSALIRMTYQGEVASIEIQNGSCIVLTPPAELAEPAERYCLNELPLLPQIGLDSISVLTLQEDGGWLASPTGTLFDTFARVGQELEKCIEEDRMQNMCM